jgi:transcriptional repressor NrdR
MGPARTLGIACPRCGSGDSKVRDSRAKGEMIRRRRVCQQCAIRFSTFEMVSDLDEFAEEVPEALLLQGLLRDIPKPIATAVSRLIGVLAKREAQLLAEAEAEQHGVEPPP